MSLTENSNQVFLPGGCNRTQNVKFGLFTNGEDRKESMEMNTESTKYTFKGTLKALNIPSKEH